MSMRDMKALLKNLEALKKDALAKGIKPIAPVDAPVAVAEPEDNDKPPVNPRTLVLNAVAQYHNAIKAMPRQLLEARYLKDVGEPCPSVSRDWIVEKMARKYQREQYLAYEGEVPQSVQRYDRIFALQKPRIIDLEGDDDAGDEPGKDEQRFDPTMKAKTVVENPFTKGRIFQLFAVVASQPNGIQYNALVAMLKVMNDWPQQKAEAKAKRVFTKWVDKGWVQLV